MLPAQLHPAVEATPIREEKASQSRLPLGAKEGGGDRVGLAVVFRHRGHPVVAVLDLEARLVPRREVAVAHEVIAGQVEKGLGEEVEDGVGRRAPRSRSTRVAASLCSAGSTASRDGRPPRAGVAVGARKRGMAFTSGGLTPTGGT